MGERKRLELGERKKRERKHCLSFRPLRSFLDLPARPIATIFNICFPSNWIEIWYEGLYWTKIKIEWVLSGHDHFFAYQTNQHRLSSSFSFYTNNPHLVNHPIPSWTEISIIFIFFFPPAPSYLEWRRLEWERGSVGPETNSATNQKDSVQWLCWLWEFVIAASGLWKYMIFVNLYLVIVHLY